VVVNTFLKSLIISVQIMALFMRGHLPHSPESSEIAESKNCTLTDLVNAMLNTCDLSKECWGGSLDFVSCSE
jgi:hypothetical protein